MPGEHRVTIRLDPEQYAELEHLGRHGQPLAAIVRQALAEYATRQPGQPMDPSELATTLADLAASLAELQGQVQDLTARVDALAATRQPPAARPRQPAADVAARTGDMTYDPDVAYGRMRELQQTQGLTLAQIAAQLTAEGLRTKQGKPWHKSTVSYILRTRGR
jgi:predicted transcriptional regulator